jgi:hypothetical protein
MNEGDHTPASVSEQLQQWLDRSDGHTVGQFVELFGDKGFALLLIILLGLPALPLPTGGATHVFEAIAILVAAQLVAGREQIWVPQRWRGMSLGGSKQRRFIRSLLRVVRFLERLSRPRLRFLFDHWISNKVYGLVVIVFTTGAFLAPPFSGLDTLPALGVVLVSLGVLLEDAAFVAAGVVVGTAGLLVEIVLGKAAVDEIKKIL